ncbi:MAG: CBS domain-containing protein [Planctomycetes bacterium]|nr:CBS domain-containing protein [Planctomycetota bacterium]
MRAREAMIPNPFTVGPETTLLQFILGVLNGNQTTASVVDGDRLVGMVSVEDVFHRLVPLYVGMTGSLVTALHESYFEEIFAKFKNTPVASVMSREIDAMSPDEPLMQAVALFANKSRKTLPVIDNGRFVGAVTRRSVLAAAARIAGA